MSLPRLIILRPALGAGADALLEQLAEKTIRAIVTFPRAENAGELLPIEIAMLLDQAQATCVDLGYLTQERVDRAYDDQPWPE